MRRSFLRTVLQSLFVRRIEQAVIIDPALAAGVIVTRTRERLVKVLEAREAIERARQAPPLAAMDVKAYLAMEERLCWDFLDKTSWFTYASSAPERVLKDAVAMTRARYKDLVQLIRNDEVGSFLADADIDATRLEQCTIHDLKPGRLIQAVTDHTLLHVVTERAYTL